MGPSSKASLIVLKALMMCLKSFLWTPWQKGIFPSEQLAFWVQVELVSNYAIEYSGRSLFLLPQVAANFLQMFSFQQIKLWMWPHTFPRFVGLGHISWGLKWCGTGLCTLLCGHKVILMTLLRTANQILVATRECRLFSSLPSLPLSPASVLHSFPHNPKISQKFIRQTFF